MARRYKTIADIPPDLLNIWETAVRDDGLVLDLANKGQAKSLQVRLYMARQAALREMPSEYRKLDDFEILVRENRMILQVADWIRRTRGSIGEPLAAAVNQLEMITEKLDQAKGNETDAALGKLGYSTGKQ